MHRESRKVRLGRAMITNETRCHPKTLAPANDQLQSRPATVYEDEAKRDEEMQVESRKKKMYVPRGIVKQAV